MLAAAKNKDPMRSIAKSRNLPSGHRKKITGPMTRYFESNASLDSILLAQTGKVAQDRFHDVQERLGLFESFVPFTAPPKRVV